MYKEQFNLMGISETAKYLGITPCLVSRAIKDGTLPSIKIGTRYYIQRDALNSYLRQTHYPGKNEQK